MTLSTLIILFVVVGIILTALFKIGTNRVNNIGLSFLQNFAGAWFIFSGFVKAVDPLGTAYKMEQYFAQFEFTFADTWMSFIAPLFPFLTAYQEGFSVFMIILEIFIGIALIIGWAPKFTSWLFFILMLFFTALTGFTFLTGYVPTDSNFFDFSSWGAFQDSQMRVKDCGCFGDFIKLKPFTSFLKDIALLLPATIFLLFHKSFHRLWTSTTRNVSLLAAGVILFVYSLSNFVWNIPRIDFRPFAEGTNIRIEKLKQEEAEANRSITHYIATNKETGVALRIPYNQYLKEFKSYPSEVYNLEQVLEDPVIVTNKISEFEVADVDGNDVTEKLLNFEGYSFWVVAYDIKAKRGSETREERDSIFVLDTLQVDNDIISKSVLDTVIIRTETVPTYEFMADYVDKWNAIVNPVMNQALDNDIAVFGITAPSDSYKVYDFQKESGTKYPIYTGDDILLKTIIRSNPGVLLMKDGKIVKKWHFKKLPSFAEIKEDYIF